MTTTVASGTTSNGLRAVQGDNVVVASGGTATSTTVANGGEQDVYGSALSTLVQGGGRELVFSGGTASGTGVQGGGLQAVSAGGSASATVVSGTGSEQDVSGTAAGTLVGSGGLELVAAGGTTASASVLSGGTLELLGGAGESGTAVASGGTLAIGSGYVETGYAATGGVTLAVLSGGTAAAAAVGSGGTLEIFGGGTATAFTVASGGTLAVGSGYVENAYTVASGTTLAVRASGLATGTVVSRGGVAAVSSGGTAVSTSVLSGGSSVVSAGGTATGTSVLGGGEQDVSGLAVSTTVAAGGREAVLAGGLASGTTVSSGGFAVVSAGGTASNAAVSSGGEQDVSGTASGTLIAAGGREVVASGGRSFAAAVASTGRSIVSAGGIATSTAIASGGEQDVLGLSVGTAVQNGGREVVSAGGVASGGTVAAGGLSIVSAGGSAILTTVAGEQDVSGTAAGGVVVAGGVVSVFAGGLASGTAIDGGRAVVAVGGTASATSVVDAGEQDVYGASQGTTVGSGGLEVVEVGGTASGGRVTSGGQQSVFGSAFSMAADNAGVIAVFSGGGTSGSVLGFAGREVVSAGATASAGIVNSGGQETVTSGGRSTSSTINSGGQQFVASGGTAVGTAVAGGSQSVLSATVTGTRITGGTQQLATSGIAVSTTILGGLQDVGPSSFASATTVLGGTQMVEAYGQAVGTAVSGGGVEVVAGLASGTVVASGGVVSVTSGGAIRVSGSSTTVNLGGVAVATVVNGGQVFVAASGTTSGSSVSNGGLETVLSSGTATSTSLSSGGTQAVSSGGTAYGTLVSTGGTLVVSSGGVASASVVNGGREVVAAGGTAANARLSSGTLVLQAGAVTSGGVLFGSAGTLEVDQVVTSGTYASPTTLSGFAVGDALDLAGLAYVSGRTTASISGSTLTVTNGSATETFGLADLKVGAFKATADASGDVLLTGIAAPAITGTRSGQGTTSDAAVTPFSGATVSDSNADAIDTLTIALSGGGGTFTGLAQNSDGTYTLTGTAAAVTTQLRGLSFKPADGTPNTSATTTFTLTDVSSAGTSATDAATTVIDTDPAVAPTIAGTVAGQAVSDDATSKPFGTVTIGDRNGGAADTLTIALSGGGGILSGANLSTNSDGSYRLTGTAAAITASLRNLSFAPKAGAPNTTATTTFTLTDSSSAGGTATDANTTVVDTDPAVAPVISGAVAGLATSDGASLSPFGNVTLTDRNSQATDTLVITLTGDGGALSGRGLVANQDGTYTLSGTPSAVTTALHSLTFTPPAAAANTSTTTGFTLRDASSAGTTATDSTTTVTDRFGAVAPTIRGTAAGQATTSEAPVSPFARVVVADGNGGATDTLTISLSGGAGALTGPAGLVVNADGTYTLRGAAADITAALQGISFKPTGGAPNTTTTTTFTLTDASSAGLTATDARTSVVDTDPGTAPVISGTAPGQTTRAEAPVTPFAGVGIADANANAVDTVTVTLDGGGTLADGGSFNGLSGSNGTYVLRTDTPANAARELDALVFTPAAGVPATSSTTAFRLDVSSSSGSSSSDTRTTVTDTAPAVDPSISGTVAGQTATDQNPVTPFAGVTLVDRNGGASDTVTVTLAGGGTLADGQGYGGLTSSGNSYTLKAGTAADVTRELEALVFTPAAGTPFTSATTRFTIADASNAGTSATDSRTSVTVSTSAAAPAIAGTAANQPTQQGKALSPFNGVTVADRNPGATETLTISLSGAGGSLSGPGVVAHADGTYSLAGSASAVSAQLQALAFTPAPASPGTTGTTRFTLTDASSAGTSATDGTTSVVDTTAPVRPTITGTVAGQTTTGGAASRPFAATVVDDATVGATEAVTLTLSGGGTLSDGQGSNGLAGSGNSYTLRAGTAAEVTRELQALVFTPAAGVPNTTSTTGITIVDASSTGLAASDGRTTLTDTTPATAPTIVGTVSGQTTMAEGAVSPFAGVTVSDANGAATDTATISLSGTGGVLTGAGVAAGPNGTYTLSGTAASISAALQGLSFAPLAGAPNTTSTTGFTLAVASSAGTAASDARTSVIDADRPVAPTIANTRGGQATSDEASVTPFAGVVVSDANADATETLRISLAGGGGTLGGDGLMPGSDGTYTLNGTAAAVTAELQALRFAATAGAYGTPNTTTFLLEDASSAGPTAQDSATAVTDTVTRVPDSVTVDPDVTFLGQGRFSISGRAYSPSGIASVTVSALIDGQTTDLGPATLATDGSFTFVDRVGADPQTFIFTAQLANDGGQLTADTHFALTAGIRDEPYVAVQDRYDPATSAFIGQTFFAKNGQIVYNSAYQDNHDGTSSYTYSGGTYFDLQPFDSYQATYDSEGTLLRLVRNENDGTHRVEIDAGGQTLASDSFDKFLNGGQTDTHFVFTPGFGHDLVGGFRVSGAGHDVLDLARSDFTDVADVLRHTQNTSHGAVIHDPTSGDTIRLAGVNKAQLAHNAEDFAFH